MDKIKVYTLEEVAENLTVDRQTLYIYIKAGKLKAFKMGKYWRVTEENFKDFLDNGTEKNKYQKK